MFERRLLLCFRFRAGPLVKTLYKVLLLDGAVILALYFVFQDLSWRTSCALGQEVDCAARTGPSFSYSLLTRSFTMSRGSMALISPPTLDWVQILAILLVVANGWYLYALIKTRRAGQEPGKGSAIGPKP